jgi:hypothetical protein
MTGTELKNLLERIQAWPEEAQNDLVAVADQIESELRSDHSASREELQAIDAAMASIDAGEFATDDEVSAAFAKFRSARGLSILGERWRILKQLRPIIQRMPARQLPSPSSADSLTSSSASDERRSLRRG